MSQQIAERIHERPELGLLVIGYVDSNGSSAVDSGVVTRNLGSVEDLRSIVEAEKPTRLIVGIADRRGSLPMQELLRLSHSGYVIEAAERTFEQLYGRVCSEYLRPSQIVFSHEFGASEFTTALQSFYSRVIAGAALLLLAPLLVVVALLVRLTSPGRALYSQRRLGLHGKPFTVYKFRSMRTDAEAKTGAVWAAKDDPRVTRIGKWLRRLRIDEFPQLWNVLKGEMSIVGPRPERPEFVETLSEQIPFYRQRLAVRPGVTGWAQINYKYGDTIEDTVRKLEYDLYYIKNLTPALDFYIMFQTIKVMLLTRGAQ
jgi:exopolysaccharide biosynthesis polyprenyl glycosylphosphotransferase